jgi:hypothetical protein
MPPIDPGLFDCVVYVYPSVEAAREGRRAGGTGFLVGVPLDDYYAELPVAAASTYAVTNAHVIGGILEKGGAPVLRANRADRTQFVVIPLDADAWIHHPSGDDLAIAPVGLPPEIRTAYLMPKDFHPSRRRDFPPGADVFMLSRFISHEGRQSNMPIVRFGNVAMLPGEPIWNRKTGANQESLLVEVRSLPGHSGSPVFGYRTVTEGDLDKGSIGVFRQLLGIDWGHFPAGFSPVLDDDKRPVKPKQWVAENSGMMGVVPIEKLDELLNDEQVVEMRKETERRLRERLSEPSVEPDLAEESEFERFEDLTRKLVQVPKKELDEKRKEES